MIVEWCVCVSLSADDGFMRETELVEYQDTEQEMPVEEHNMQPGGAASYIYTSSVCAHTCTEEPL